MNKETMMTGKITQELIDLGYSIESTLIEDLYTGRDGNHMHKVTISYKGLSMDCEFTSGWGDRTNPKTGKPPIQARSGRLTVLESHHNAHTVPNDPSLEDVIYSLLMDASVGRNALSFGEFCDDLGYDEDSRKAYNVFTSCQEQYTKLKRLCVDLDSLDELYEDF